MRPVLLSDEVPRIEWSDTGRYSEVFGVKGGTSLAIPRPWTPPFALISADLVSTLTPERSIARGLGDKLLGRVLRLATTSALIVRSSVVGESIWDRGTYESVHVEIVDNIEANVQRLDAAARQVVLSTGGRRAGLMIQCYVPPVTQGEFGNLLRISKTRDHWEISIRDSDGLTSRQRLNSQRDRAAEPDVPLAVRSGLARERMFGAIGAWINNELMLGRSQRVNCEWITDNRQFFIVQIDEEDEDLKGVSPFQVRIPPIIRPSAAEGAYLKLAAADSLKIWDKLQVLDQLWEPEESHKPTLFFVPFSCLPPLGDERATALFEADFRKLVGPSGIIVRTSVRAGTEKLPNLPRTEGLTPEAATRWCLTQAGQLSAVYGRENLAFVVHRFVAARASAWARAEPGNPLVEINALWGLPDALQYCPYDIWEVHVPTGVATDYPEYKSDMLIAQADGQWEYVRVKNELARSNSIGSGEAKDVAARSLRIAERLGRPCHIMWFVGCLEHDGAEFNIPWYWTEAHEADRNPDRSAYRVFTVTDEKSLAQFVDWKGERTRQALALRPTLALMRDNNFIENVGRAAAAAKVPIVLSGSTLAHAYYQLRKLGCTIVTPSEKEHTRIRRAVNLGKLVRDKIPERIAKRHEFNITRQVPGNLRKGFLISKLFEEAIEVREAVDPSQRMEELADLYEVFRALAKVEGVSLDSIEQTADQKRRKAGGFDEGLVLLQTAISVSDRATMTEWERGIGEVLADQTGENVIDIPFSFFGFIKLDRPQSINFDRLGMRLELVLRHDRLQIRLVRGPEQLSLPFNS